MKIMLLIIGQTTASKSFEYNTKIKGSTPDDNNTLDAEVVVPSKYLSNFWRSLDLFLINCEIELRLSWSKKCIIREIYRTSNIPALISILIHLIHVFHQYQLLMQHFT